MVELGGEPFSRIRFGRMRIARRWGGTDGARVVELVGWQRYRIYVSGRTGFRRGRIFLKERSSSAEQC
jgi:hypothetical protein